MKLYGEEVPQSVIDAANAAMVGKFSFLQICNALPAFGVGVDYGRVADRLLQRARKAGKIHYKGGYWHEVVR